MESKKRYAVWLAVVLAVVLGGGSVAFACTRYVGSFTVTGDGPGSGSVTSVGLDPPKDFTECPGSTTATSCTTNASGVGVANSQQILSGGFARVCGGPNPVIGCGVAPGSVTIETAHSGAVPAIHLGDGSYEHNGYPGGTELPGGIYEVWFQPLTYTSHDTTSTQSTQQYGPLQCVAEPGRVKLGVVTVATTGGVITDATPGPLGGAGYTAGTANFKLPLSAPNVNPDEGSVCLTGGAVTENVTKADGITTYPHATTFSNMAPVTIL